MIRGLTGVLLVSASALFADPLPEPLTDADFPPVDMAEVELGRLLFWDAELSGNWSISCASCHHSRFGTSDGLSLGIGEGGIGLGPDRRPDPDNYPEQRIPRNAPALWNVGAYGFTVLFADGRIEADPGRPTGFRTPLEDEMVTGFDSILSAQTMFPVLSQDEMAGHYTENEISTLIRSGRITGPDGAWSAIAARIAAIPEYEQMFEAVYPDIEAGRPIAFTDISNAIAAYMAFDFRSDTSPFDAYLRGQAQLDPDAMDGLRLFYGDAGCSTCHSGPLLTDMRFHAMGDQQIGPGKAERFENHQRDTGRQRVTGRPEDAYAFRTPSLRNVTLTAPYGHAGAFSDLKRYLVAHMSRGDTPEPYDLRYALLPEMDLGTEDWPLDGSLSDRAGIAEAARAVPFNAPELRDAEISSILAFLQALEDLQAVNGGRMGIPDTVPSGLAVER
jgi:cytochrome c peroxidase